MPETGATPDEAAYGLTEGFAPFDPHKSDQSVPSAPTVAVPLLPKADPPAAFDSRFREEFSGLLYIGALTDSFHWLGHEFRIRTLTTGELAEIALAVKPYVGSESDFKAYQAAVVAGCLITVDNQPLPSPITTEIGDTPFLNRFRYVMDKYHPPVVNAIYERYYALEIKVREVIEAMGNRSG